MFTVNIADDSGDTTAKVNSADPGYTGTDMTGNNAPQTVQEGAIEIVRLAQLLHDGLFRGSTHKDGAWPW